MTLQHFLKVRCESMIVKKIYVTSRIQLQKWIHKSKTFAWYKLLVKQQHEIWNGTKHSYTYKLYVQMKILKLTRSESNGRSGTHRLTLWIHTINVNLQSNVPIDITTVTYKQQKLSNVVNLKCKIYQQAFNVASNKNTYRFLAIHQYIIPIHVYITPMCMSIITKILLKATILSPLTALILPCRGKLTITHLLMWFFRSHHIFQWSCPRHELNSIGKREYCY